MAWVFLDSTARSEWLAGTSQTAQLTALAALWSGNVELRYYTASDGLLGVGTHPAWDPIDTTTNPAKYSLTLQNLSGWTPSATGTATYCVVSVPSGSDILRATLTASISVIAGSRVNLDNGAGGSGLRINAAASLPATDVPAWVPSSTDTWTEIADTSFEAWADGGGITAGSYRGTDPFAAMIDAYSEMAQTADGSAAYIYGGGHGDGSCNAVVKCDFSDFSYTVVGNPTPPSVYLSAYMDADPGISLAEILYPSGAFFSNSSAQLTGWFKTVAEGLNATTDAGYIAPALARVCTHMYGAAAMCGSKIVYPYLEYGEFTPGTGAWSGYGIDLGAQLNAISTQYTDVPLQQGTTSVYDPTTQRMFISMVGGGFRSGIIVFDPVAQTIESVHRSGTFGNIENAVDLKMVGRDLYVIAGNDGTPRVMDWGFICDMDDLAAATGDNTMAEPSTRAFTIGGDTGGSTYTSNSTQDIIPSFYDGTAIRRWNYNSTYRNKILSVSLTPASGLGTVASPYVLTQTERTISGTITGPTGQEVVYVYSRLLWVPSAGAAVVIPRASSNWYALKLS